MRLTSRGSSFEVDLENAGTTGLSMPATYMAEHYNYFRDYSPEIGRYIQSDPIGLRGGSNTYAYARLNPLARTDSLGLATAVEINAAIKTFIEKFPQDFSKLPSSVSVAPMGDDVLGGTDPENNILLNSGRFRNSDTCVRPDDEPQFLQTLAHEMLHVNQQPFQRWLSERFRMNNPLGLGYFHNKLDDQANDMLSDALVRKYLQYRNSDKGRICKK